MIRKFTLFDINKYNSIELASNGIFASNPVGLGNNFESTYVQDNRFKQITNTRPLFEEISFDIYFNINGTNGYKNFNKLINFINYNGKQPLILRYKDGINEKFCRVMFKRMPKTEINQDGEFVETFVFDRLTYWYMENDLRISLQNAVPEEYVTYPLPFEFGFEGLSLQKEYTVTNNFFDSVPIEVRIKGELKENIELYIKNFNNDEIIQRVKFLINSSLNQEIIMSSVQNKKVTIIRDGIEENGYGYIDMNYQTFLYLPQGTYVIGSSISNEDNGSINFSIIQYLLD